MEGDWHLVPFLTGAGGACRLVKERVIVDMVKAQWFGVWKVKFITNRG